LLPDEIAICDFSKRSGPWIPNWTRVCNPEELGFGIREILVQGTETSEIAIMRFPIEQREEATWQGESARAHRSLGFRDS
jgi:hypothetical protein